MTRSTNVRKKTRIMLMIFSTPMIVTKFDSYILRYITQVSRVKVQSFRPKPKNSTYGNNNNKEQARVSDPRA